MSDLTDFLPKILQYAPGCAEPAAFDALREAGIEFCERTKLWRVLVEETSVSYGPVAITVPAGAVLHDIDTVFIGDRELTPKTTQWLDEKYPEWRGDEFTGTARYYTQTAEDEITLIPFEAEDIKIYVRLKPSQDATELPDFLFSRYLSTIQAGALAKILLLPGQPFMSPELAGAFGQKFYADLDRLSDKQITGQQRAPRRTRGQFF